MALQFEGYNYFQTYEGLLEGKTTMKSVGAGVWSHEIYGKNN